MDEKSAVKDNDLEIVEISEFKRSDAHRQITKHEEQERKKRYRIYGILTLFAVGFLSMILVGIFALHLPLVLLCVVFVLETAVAVCLYDRRGWVQILEIVIGIAAGIIFGRLSLMIAGEVVYLGAVVALRGMKDIMLLQTHAKQL